MRTSAILIVFTALLYGCSSGDASVPASSAGLSTDKAAGTTTIEWIDSARNYGKITEGQKLAVTFRFKNTGKAPLVIESVTPSCGCTVADFPKEPVAPGGEGEITGEFDSQSREGLQHKELTVAANIPGRVNNVFFEVTVAPDPNSDKENPNP